MQHAVINRPAWHHLSIARKILSYLLYLQMPWPTASRSISWGQSENNLSSLPLHHPLSWYFSQPLPISPQPCPHFCSKLWWTIVLAQLIDGATKSRWIPFLTEHCHTLPLQLLLAHCLLWSACFCLTPPYCHHTHTHRYTPIHMFTYPYILCMLQKR